ncbi:hypothetical protein [Streptomyces sp. NPDC059155]
MDGHHRTDVLERCVVDRDEFERLNTSAVYGSEDGSDPRLPNRLPLS